MNLFRNPIPSTLFFMLLASGVAHGANDDLIIQSRLDGRTTSWFIDKTRTILTNNNLSDGLTDTVPLTDDTIFPINDFSTNPNFQKIKDTLAAIFKVNAKEAYLRLRIPKIYYNVHSLHARPEEIKVEDPSLRIKATAELQGVDIGLTEGLQIEFLIPNPKTKIPEAYLTGSLKPVGLNVPDTLKPAEFQVELETQRSHSFTLKLLSYDLSALPEYVNQNINQIAIFDSVTHAPISTDLIAINPVVIKLNSLSRSVTFDEFKPVIERGLQKIVQSVIKQVGIALKDSIGPRILRSVFNANVPSSLSVSSRILYTRYQIQTFTQPEFNQLSLWVSGDLCSQQAFQTWQTACVDHEPPPGPVRVIDEPIRAEARDELRAKIASGDSDVAVSVSEEYLNRLIKTTIDAHLWESMLKEQNLELGPRGAFVVFPEGSENPELYLDVLYKGQKGLQHLLINPRHPIRFPLRMSTQVSISIQNEIPVVNIKIDRIQSNPDEIIHGIPEYQLPSKLIFLFRCKIARLVLKMSQKIEGKNALELQLPVLKGIGLEKVWAESSAKGRLNLFFKI